jgi:hypothetical protein
MKIMPSNNRESFPVFLIVSFIVLQRPKILAASVEGTSPAIKCEEGELESPGGLLASLL